MVAECSFIAQRIVADDQIAGPAFEVERREVVDVGREHQPSRRGFKGGNVPCRGALMNLDLESHGWPVEQFRP
jgi:hypothetical protein